MKRCVNGIVYPVCKSVYPVCKSVCPVCKSLQRYSVKVSVKLFRKVVLCKTSQSVWRNPPSTFGQTVCGRLQKDLQRTLSIARNDLPKVVLHKRFGIYMHFSLFMGRMHRPPKCVSCGVCPKILNRCSNQHP